MDRRPDWGNTQDMTGRLLAALLACLLLTACGDSGGAKPAASPSNEDSPPRSASPTATSADPPAGTEIVVADSEFGPMLFNTRKQAIYLFDVEKTEEPKCYDDCADAWPPVLTKGEPVAGRAVKRSLLGTTTRSDGTTQVTYGGHPLYYYAHEGPGEVECHDVFLNGGTWYVVQPDGTRA